MALKWKLNDIIIGGNMITGIIIGILVIAGLFYLDNWSN